MRFLAIPLAGAALTAVAGLSVAPATASAAAATSTNWGGYAAVSKSSASFRKVSATWTVPWVNCGTRSPAYSAAWVGLGGFDTKSRALEQAGTDADCGRSARARYAAWYELLPAGSKTIDMKVRPGDAISASVEVHGKEVSVRLRNRTTGASFKKTVKMSSPDTSSAEWIVEAPSFCDASGKCKVQPLSDFGSVPFSGARARNTRDHSGTISDGAWQKTRITLRTRGLAKGSSDGATASALSSAGAAFSMTYQDEVARPSRRARTFPGSAH